MRATFRPANEDSLLEAESQVFGGMPFIKALIVDESGPGVEIRIMSDGNVLSLPLTSGVEHYRSSPMWEEILDEPT